MTTSIIIPVYNNKSFIEKSINSLLQQTNVDFEIIIVDDGSTDGTKEALRKYNSDRRINISCYKENRGPAWARNMAIKKSCGQFLAFIDSDCIASPQWLNEIIKPFSMDESIMISAGQTLDAPPSNYWEGVNKGENFIQKDSGFVRQAIGCNMAIRRIFITNHSFDEEIPTAAAEETDLCLFCLEEGHKIFYNTNAQVIHHRRSSLISTMNQQFRYGFYNTYVRLKHRHFPYINYGTWLLAALLLIKSVECFSENSFLKKAAMILLLIYLFFIFFANIYGKKKNLLEAILYYPGFLVCCLANASGNFCYIIQLIGKRPKRA